MHVDYTKYQESRRNSHRNRHKAYSNALVVAINHNLMAFPHNLANKQQRFWNVLSILAATTH